MSTANVPSNSPPPTSETPPSTTTVETSPTTTTAETPPVKTPEQTAAETAAAAPLTAESIKIPEGFIIDDATRDSFLGIMNDDKMSGAERAQKLIDLQTNLIKTQDEALTKAWETQQETWVNEVKADPEVGGDKMEPTLAAIAKVVLEYGTPEVAEILTNTGAGNNVHIVKMMSKIAKALNEGSGHASGNPPAETKTTAQKLFPSMK